MTDVLTAEKQVLRLAAELALDVLLHCVRPGLGVDDPADRLRAIEALKAALSATAV